MKTVNLPALAAFAAAFLGGAPYTVLVSSAKYKLRKLQRARSCSPEIVVFLPLLSSARGALTVFVAEREQSYSFTSSLEPPSYQNMSLRLQNVTHQQLLNGVGRKDAYEDQKRR